MTVEELRAIAINVMRNIDVPSYPELIDLLIAAAKEEGRKEGYDAGYTEGRTDWYLHHPPLV